MKHSRLELRKAFKLPFHDKLSIEYLRELEIDAFIGGCTDPMYSVFNEIWESNPDIGKEPEDFTSDEFRDYARATIDNIKSSFEMSFDLAFKGQDWINKQQWKN